jgi:hypothetical protein
MPSLRNPQHEAFAQAAAVPGMRLIDAYATAGYVPRRGNPDRLARHPKVAARIKELQSDVDPADLANLERIHEKIIDVAWRVRAAAGNRDAAARRANDARELAAALDREADDSRWLADSFDHDARLEADLVQRMSVDVAKLSAADHVLARVALEHSSARATEAMQRAAVLDRGQMI